MDNRKARIFEALDGFVNQRPGLDPRDYGGGPDGLRCYRSESRSITKDLHNYYAIRNEVIWRDSITADMLIDSFERAFSGRLSISMSRWASLVEDGDKVTLNYCAGQYMPTEYRKAACAVLANAWWSTTRKDCPVEYDPDAPANKSPGQWMRDTAKRTFKSRSVRAYFC